MLPKDLTRDVIKRLHYVKGQLEGLERMLTEEQDPDQILNQFKAAQKGLDEAHYQLLDEVYRKALARKIVESVDACPGNCGQEDKIRFIKEQFPNLDLDDLTGKLKEMDEIAGRLKKAE